jgi:hypothetical protein
MVQRVQSLLLLAIFGCSIASFFVPLMKFSFVDHFYILDSYGLKITTIQTVSISTFYWLTAILNACIGVFSLMCFTSYKNRNFQILLSKINSFLVVILMAFIYYSYEISTQKISETNSAPPELSLKLGVLLPILSLILSLLAIYFIKKDEELVRSADRIR